MSRDSAAKICPYCNSSEVITTAKASPSDYQRCARCGELWHPDRISAYHKGSGSTTARPPIAGRW